MMEWAPIILTLKLAAITTFILFWVSLPIARWLSVTKSNWKPVIETIVAMPLVLPPTVLGFYLLVALSPSNAFGAFLLDTFHLRLIFTFEGLVLASVIYSFPFMVHPIQSGLNNLPASLSEASDMLGKSRYTTFFKVLLPNIKPSILTGIVLSFAHTIGEFGVVLMIGGNIPNETKVASIAIYDEVELLNYEAANFYALVLFLIAFIILFLVYFKNGGYVKKYLK